MADPSQAQAALDPRVQSDSILARLPVDLASLPPEVLTRLQERARAPDRRLMVGRYVITGELGRGGMGVVYDAWDPGIERRVAIKTIEPDLVPEEDREEIIERFRRETKIVGRLHHPGIVTIFDYGEERDQSGLGSRLYYYVMEYLEGQSLARVLRERRSLPDVEAVDIVADVLEALHVSHTAGVIHRDIKPSNIFLRGGKKAVILDFGIAKTGSVALTRQGQILGTPSYLAPERLREKEIAVDGRADIFSLGVLLFTMLAGEAPFVGEDVYDVIDKIAKQSHPKLARTTPSGQALSRVIDKMLAKRPDDRYANAAEAAAALRDVERLLEDKPAPMEMLLTGGVRIRDALPETATEIATPSSALAAVYDEEDTGRHHVGTVPTISKAGPRASSESMAAPPATSAEILGEVRIAERATELASSDSPLHLDASRDGAESALRAESAPRPDVAQRPEGSLRPEGPTRGENPIRIADLLGTRPEIALQRETREIRSSSPPPPLPRAMSMPAYSEGHEGSDSGEFLSGEYESHAPGNDETTDDQTIADPDAARKSLGEMAARLAPAAGAISKTLARPSSSPAAPILTKSPSGMVPAVNAKALSGPTPVAPMAKSPSGPSPVPNVAKSPSGPNAVPPARTPSKAPRAGDDRQTEQIVRAGGAEHSEQKTEQQDRSRPSVRPAAARPKDKLKRSRIEASLVDEDDVVVKPAPLDALKPDELPTQTGFRVPASAASPVAEDLRARESIPDPAEPQETTEGGVMIEERGPGRAEFDLEEGSVPELDVPRSAAVARRTFGARSGAGAGAAMKSVQVKPGAPVQVRVSGALTGDRLRVVRRRGFMLLIAMLAAIAVGLFLGRMKQRSQAVDVDLSGEQPKVIEPKTEPKVSRPNHDSTASEPELVKPRPASELIQDATVALGEHNVQKAAELFEKATRAAPERSRIRGQAMLGYADAARQLGKKEQAIELYRAVLAELPKTPEADEARVALTDLGVSVEGPGIAPVTRKDTAVRAVLPAAKKEPAHEAPKETPAPTPAKDFDYAKDITADMSPDAKCRAIMAKLINLPEEAVKALQRLAGEDPRASCAYWYLGNSYSKLKEDRAAMTAYKRYLELRPDAANRAAVEERIKNLASKLDER